MKANNILTPDYLFDNTLNNSSCLQQATNPSLQCHAIDNYWLRTKNMASYFAPKIDTCSHVGIWESKKLLADVRVFPNPAKQTVSINLAKKYQQIEVQIVSQIGRLVQVHSFENISHIKLDLDGLEMGIYMLDVRLNNDLLVRRKVVVGD